MTEPRVPGKLGRLPLDPNRPKLTLGPRLSATVPPNPAVVDWLSKVQAWPMYGNSEWGCCVWSMIGHQIEAASTYGTGTTVQVTEQALLKGYSDVTGFNPNDPSTDQGTVIQDALSYWQKTGISGHKILAYASVNITNRTEIDAALNLFGSLAVGVDFPKSAMDQFNTHQPWDVLVDDGGIEGGHAIHHGYYNTANLDERIVTWGAVQGMTDTWWAKYVREAWVVVTPEWLDSTGHSPEGLDLYGLGEDFAALTGKPNPFPAPTPQPVPTPVPPVTPPAPAPSPEPTPAPPVPVVDRADTTFAVTLRHFVKHPYVYSPHHLAELARTWLAAKGL